MDFAVIMAGGSGTRLWPLSRDKRPKQSLELTGDRSMFQLAVERIKPLFPAEQIFVVTREEYAGMLRAQWPELDEENFILEPEGRGTAPAIGLAALHLQQKDPTGTMTVLTADHYIADPAGFRGALSAALEVAQQNYLVTLGIQPTSPSTGYGYIEMGEPVSKSKDLPAYRVNRFVEKPNLQTAVEMVTSGRYSWNSGMFIWRIDRIMEEFTSQMPEFAAQLQELSGGLGSGSYREVITRVWPQVGKQTIDYGVMEKAASVAVIPIQVGWVDVGSWASLDLVLPLDEKGNAFTGPHVEIDTRNTLVFMSSNRLAAIVGVENLVIVDTEDALLVCPKEREQEVREVVRLLKEAGKTEYL
jgi:mannose-1-phosphate guanylyltransferase